VYKITRWLIAYQDRPLSFLFIGENNQAKGPLSYVFKFLGLLQKQRFT